MRIFVLLNGTQQILPFNTQHNLIGYIHKCLGVNDYHDKPSDYSISMLNGGVMLDDKTGIDFTKGGYFTITTCDNEFLNRLMIGIMLNPTLFLGITFKAFDNKVNSIEHVRDGLNYFVTLSPILLKRHDNDHYDFITVNDHDFAECLEAQTRKKMSKILGRDVELKLTVDDNPNHKTRTVIYDKVKNIASYCQVNIECSKEVANIIYNIGLGQSTGCGFGTMYLTHYHDIYHEKFNVRYRIKKMKQQTSKN